MFLCGGWNVLLWIEVMMDSIGVFSWGCFYWMDVVCVYWNANVALLIVCCVWMDECVICVNEK